MPISDPPAAEFAQHGVYYLDYMADIPRVPGSAPDVDWSSYWCTKPENLAADDVIGGAGNCSWEWTISADDVEGNPIVREYDFIDAFSCWWRLRCGPTVIIAGPVTTGLSGKLGSQFMTCAGMSWETYLARWQYPFDPRPDHVNDYRFSNSFVGDETSPSGVSTPTGLVYQCGNRDIVLIAGDLLGKTQNGVSDRMKFDLSALDNPIGITTNFQYTLGDDSYINGALTSLTGIGEGFDYWITWNRKFKIGSPYRYGAPVSPTIAFFIDITTPGLLDLDYENSGRQGTHVLGRGAGVAVQTQMGAAYGYAPLQDLYTRLDISYDFGDVRNQTQLNNLTKKALSIGINPVRQITLSLDPSQIVDYWRIFRKGRALYITIDLGYHQIDAPYRIKSWTLADEENTGNMKVDLTLDRIYPQYADFGNPDL